MDKGTIGWQRLIVVTAIATTAAILADRFGLVNKIMDMMQRG
jgi:hypothetical protein